MSEWISVTDKEMPEDGDFLVYLETKTFGSRVEVAHCHTNMSIIGGHFKFDMPKVTYWMPLSEPPKDIP
jgi:hypothetical protein